MILSITDTIEDLFNTIKIFIQDIFSIFPSDIFPYLTAMFAIILALFIYRLLRWYYDLYRFIFKFFR